MSLAFKHEIIDRDIASLKPYGNNARTHSKKQVAQIARSIERFGFTNPVLVSDDLEIIAGHGRVEAAKQLGLKTVPTLALRRARREVVPAVRKLVLWRVEKERCTRLATHRALEKSLLLARIAPAKFNCERIRHVERCVAKDRVVRGCLAIEEVEVEIEERRGGWWEAGAEERVIKPFRDNELGFVDAAFTAATAISSPIKGNFFTRTHILHARSAPARLGRGMDVSITALANITTIVAVPFAVLHVAVAS